MSKGNEWLATAPFEIYQLRLFLLVAEERSFTRGAAKAGITQSAITRQIGKLEESLGVGLLERTTRWVRLTEAGEAFAMHAHALLTQADAALRELRDDFSVRRQQIRLGVSSSLSTAHLPGLLHAAMRRAPEHEYRLHTYHSDQLLTDLAERQLDLVVLNADGLSLADARVVHRFEDSFVLLGSESHGATFEGRARSAKARNAWLAEQTWMGIDEGTRTARELDRWLKTQGWAFPRSMTFDSYDLMVHAVGLGLGVGFVPIRALASYPRKNQIVRLELPKRFTRTLSVLT